jgi:F420-dependent oxidoreductase-like protein
MKLGLQITDYTLPGGPSRLGATLAEIAQTAEGCGFDSIGVTDHVWQVPPWMGPPEQEMLECYATLAFLAAHTSRLTLMAMVTAVPFRYPGILAKTVTTLDVLSGGRAWLGIGAGHYADEAYGLGIPFPPLKQRFEMLEETVQICLHMWSGERGDERPYRGTHYRLERQLNVPQSLTRPHPPILIAGEGEQQTLRLVARYADACNVRPSPEIPRKLDVLRTHCAAEDRDYDAIEKTCAFRFDIGEDGSKVDELIGQLRWLAGMGIRTVFGAVPHVHQITPLEMIGREVIPAVAEM